MLKYFLALIALVPLTALAAQKDADDLPRWYQIELLIFQQNDVDTEEVFRDQPFELEQNSILSQAPLLNSLLNKLPNGKRQPEPPIPAEEVLDTDTDIVVPTVTEPAVLSDLDAETNFATELSDSSIEETPEETIVEVETPTFIAASEADLELAEHEEKLRRRRAYRVLWYGAWQQALEENIENTYLISAGGLILQPSEEEAELDTGAEVNTDIAEPLDTLINSLTSSNPVDITAEELHTPVDGSELLEMTEEQRLDEAIAIVESAPPTFRELQGSIKILKTRFAHLDIDLWFTQIDPSIPPINVPQLTVHEIAIPEIITAEQLEPEALEIPTVTAQDFLDDADTALLAEQTEEPEPRVPSYTMNYELAHEPLLYGHIEENRRLRSKELYYVDHPMFGMIIKMVEVPHPLLRIEPDQVPSELIDPLDF